MNLDVLSEQVVIFILSFWRLHEDALADTGTEVPAECGAVADEGKAEFSLRISCSGDADKRADQLCCVISRGGNGELNHS